MENNIYKPNRFQQFIKDIVLMVFAGMFFSFSVTGMVTYMVAKYVRMTTSTSFSLFASLTVVIFLAIFVTTKHIKQIEGKNNQIIIKFVGGLEEVYNLRDYTLSHTFTISRFSQSIKEKKLIVANKSTQNTYAYDFSSFSNSDFEEILNIAKRYESQKFNKASNAKAYKQEFLIKSTLDHDHLKAKLRRSHLAICFFVLGSIIVDLFVLTFYLQDSRRQLFTILDILINEGVLWLIIAEAGLLSYFVKQNIYNRRRIEIDRQMVPERIIIDLTEMTINNLVIPYDEIVKIQITPVNYQKPYEIVVTTHHKQYRCIFEECRPSYEALITSLSIALDAKSKVLDLKIISSMSVPY